MLPEHEPCVKLLFLSLTVHYLWIARWREIRVGLVANWLPGGGASGIAACFGGAN